MVYYYELQVSDSKWSVEPGKFEASSDEEAMQKMPENTLVLYRESDTDDGRPFVTLYEKSD